MTAYILLFTEASVALAALAIAVFVGFCAYLESRCYGRALRTASLFGVLAVVCVFGSVAQAQESRPSGVYDYARSTLDRKVTVEPGGKLRSEPVPPRTGRSIEYKRPAPTVVVPVDKDRPLTDKELFEIFNRPSNPRNR